MMAAVPRHHVKVLVILTISLLNGQYRAAAEFNIAQIRKNERPKGLVFKGDVALEYCLESCADKIPSGTHIWFDSWSANQTCAWYGADSIRCDRYGNYYRNFGLTANEACCTCGGGYQYVNTSIPATTKIVTDSTDHFKVQLSELDPDYVRDCKPALRLTLPEPDQTSAVWHETRQTVFDGFETKFTFRLSNRSRYCDSAENKNDGRTFLYKACKNVMSSVFKSQMEGGDGFAFVVQNSENGTDALGEGAGGLGFTGMRNSLAVEFDTFTNTGEPNFPHISIRAAGINQMNNAYPSSSLSKHDSYYDIKRTDFIQGEAMRGTVPTRWGSALPEDLKDRHGYMEPRPTSHETELAPAVEANFADGEEHTSRIVFYRGIKNEFHYAYKASQMLKQFATGPIMTLCVFLDDLTKPLVCVPLNIHATMPLINNQAIVGFTASTGRQWQATDILSWKFCESGECP